MTRYLRKVLLFLCLCVGLGSVSVGCLSKVPRACETDQQCAGEYPHLYCYKNTCRAENCEPGEQMKCYSGPSGTKGIGICREGVRTCDRSGRWTPCLGEVLPGIEICDRVDNDCNGQTDEPPKDDNGQPLAPLTWCQCKTPGAKQKCYSGAKGTLNKGECQAGIQFCERDFLWGECLAQTYPSVERCDGIDNNCDGQIDERTSCPCQEGDTQICYPGAKAEIGVGPCTWGSQTCTANNAWGPCENAVVAKEEICGNQIDENCNGQLDDGCDQACKGNQPNLCAGECVNILSSANHCGACNQPIPEGYRCCKGTSTAIQLDTQNCGACGNVCQQDEQCSGGVCKPTCQTSDSFCDKRCVDLQSNLSHCGTCGNACANKQLCQRGSCVQCTGDLNTCGNTCCTQTQRCCNNTTCVDLQSDTQNCGACGQSCGTKEQCVKGNCTCQNGDQRACYTGKPSTLGVGVCFVGIQTCTNDTWSTCQSEVTPTPEDCNGKDDDCNGQVDDNLPIKACPKQNGPCQGVNLTCDKGTWLCKGQDIADKERCDGVDNDCNGQVDDALDPKEMLCTKQAGVCAGQYKRCINGVLTDCNVFNYSKDDSLCDTKDNDCDGQVDEDCQFCAPSALITPAVVDDQRGLQGGFFSLAQHPNGQWLAWRVAGKTNVAPKVNLWSGPGSPSLFTFPTTARTGPIAFSQDGKQLFIAEGSNIAVWDVVTRLFLITIEVKSAISSILAHPKAPELFVASGSQIKHYSATTGQLLRTLTGHTSTINQITANNKGDLLASASSDRTVRLWNLNTYNTTLTLNQHQDVVNDVAFSPKGDMLATASGFFSVSASPKEKAIRLFDLSGKIIATIDDTTTNFHNKPALQVAFGYDGSFLYSASGQGDASSIRIWDLATPSSPRLMRILYGLVFTTEKLFVGGRGKTLIANERLAIQRWQCPLRCTTWTQTKTQAHTGGILSMRLSANNQTLYTSGPDKTFGVWDHSPTGPLQLTKRTSFPAAVDQFSLLPYETNTGYYIAYGQSVDWGKNTRNVNSASAAKYAQFDLKSPIVAMEANPHDFFRVIATKDKKLHFYNAFTTSLSTDTQTLPELPTSLSISPDGRYVAVGMEKGKVEIYDWKSRNKLSTLPTRVTPNAPTGADIVQVLFHPLDSRILAVAYDKELQLWDLRAPTTPLKTTFQLQANTQTQAITRIAFSPNGSWLLTGATDGTLREWSVSNGTLTNTPLHSTQANNKAIQTLLWSTDGQTLYTGHEDGAVWQLSGTNCK